MLIRLTRRAVIGGLALAATGLGVFAVAQSVSGGFDGFWGPLYGPSPTAVEEQAPLAARSATAIAEQERRSRPAPLDPRSRLIHWNRIAIDASGVDHTPVASGENRVFGEQLGPGRASRVIAIVHIAIFDAVNAIHGKWHSYTRQSPAPIGASVDAAIAQAAHDTLAAMFPSQAESFKDALKEDLARIEGKGKEAGRAVGRRAAAAILAARKNDGADRAEPRMDTEFIPGSEPGQWRQDPVSKIPVALGAYWGEVEPFVLQSGSQFRAPSPPAMTTAAYATAFDEVKRLGGNGTTSPTERTDEQTAIGIYWAYDGTPSLCAPPRLYNQIAITIADQMRSDFLDLTRLLALVNVAMADSGIAIWESKFHYQLWRPITGIRESDPGTGPSGEGDGNGATVGDPTFEPLGAPASNLTGPDFTPPFPAYPRVMPASAVLCSRYCAGSMALTTSRSRSPQTSSTVRRWEATA